MIFDVELDVVTDIASDTFKLSRILHLIIKVNYYFLREFLYNTMILVKVMSKIPK